MELAFHLIATTMFAFTAVIWSSNGWHNIAVRVAFILATALGAIVTAADMIARGWLA